MNQRDLSIGLPDQTGISAVRPCEAAPFLKQHHYLGTLPTSANIIYGAYENGKLVAIAAYGHCHHPRSPKGWLELRRLAAFEMPLPLSAFLSRTLRILKAQGVPAVITFADPAAGHHGGIYQATNFILAQPASFNWNSSFRKPDGTVVNHRTAFKLCGSSAKDKVLAAFPEWTPFRPHPKYRYVMPLNIRKKKALAILGCNELPYPKPGKPARTKELPR